MVKEVCKTGEFKESLAVGRLVDDLMLEHPGEVMWNENRIEACR